MPIQVSITDIESDTNNQVLPQSPINKPVPEIDTEAGSGPNTQAHRNGNNQIPKHDQALFDYFKALGLFDKVKSEKFRLVYQDNGFPTYVEPLSRNIIFEESIVGDSERPYKNLQSMAKW